MRCPGAGSALLAAFLGSAIAAVTCRRRCGTGQRPAVFAPPAQVRCRRWILKYSDPLPLQPCLGDFIPILCVFRMNSFIPTRLENDRTPFIAGGFTPSSQIHPRARSCHCPADSRAASRCWLDQQIIGPASQAFSGAIRPRQRPVPAWRQNAPRRCRCHGSSRS